MAHRPLTRNVSTARDLGKLISAAYRQPLIRQFTQDTSRRCAFQACLQPDVQQHQPAGEEPGLGRTPLQDRLHRRGGPLPADACQTGSSGLAIVLLNSVGKRTLSGMPTASAKWLKS